MIALVLHGGLAGTIFFMSRTASARHAQLPAVSVRIVQPDPPKTRRRAAPAAQPTLAPKKKTPVPVPTEPPEPVATAIPEFEAPTQQASEDAMAAPEQKATPRPTQSPAPSSSGSGLSVGGSSDQQTAGIPSDFHFVYYVQRMLALIESRWYKPVAPAETHALVRFTINRDGRVSRIELEASSGNSSFDRAALRALYAANPLPPLPPAYSKPSLTVHLTFSE
jgi:periplasmic protein TonB